MKLAEIQRATHKINKCAVLCLGDIVEGELIFPGSHLIDSSLYRQVTVDGPRMMHSFLSILLENFQEVDVYWVIGNHGALGGRSRKDYNPESNADRMLGKILQTMFKGEKRIKFIIPEGVDNHWYTVANLGKLLVLCFHGDNIRGTMGVPFMDTIKKY